MTLSRLPPRRVSNGRLVQGVLVTEAAAAADGDLTLFQTLESAIRAGAVGEISAPRVSLRIGAGRDR